MINLNLSKGEDPGIGPESGSKGPSRDGAEDLDKDRLSLKNEIKFKYLN